MSAGDRMLIDLHNERDAGFRKLWRNGIGSDVTLVVEGRRFRVHSFPIRAAIPEFVWMILQFNDNSIKNKIFSQKLFVHSSIIRAIVLEFVWRMEII